MSNIEDITTSLSGLFESVWNILSYPGKREDDLAASMLELLREYNLDPIYTCTIIVNLLLLTYLGTFRKWRKQSNNDKHFAIIHVTAATMFSLWSLLKLLGVIDL